MSTIFISHSSSENELARKVAGELRSEGHTSLFLDSDPCDGIPGGRIWEHEIYRKISSCSRNHRPVQ